MCLVFVGWRAHPRYPLVVAANRDEFHGRPTVPAAPWGDEEHRADPERPARRGPGDAPQGVDARMPAAGHGDIRGAATGGRILAGRDLQAGGTWLGMTPDGRFAALTNFSGSSPPSPDAPSRGRLVVDYLRSGDPARAHAREVARDAERYSGFNLLLADRDALVCVTNRGRERVGDVPAGCHGLGNDRLDAPWPKVTAGLADFRRVIAGAFETEDLFALLAGDAPVGDADLAAAPIAERVRTARFIRNEVYGTRSSTVVRIDSTGAITFEERSFDARAEETGRVAFASPGGDRAVFAPARNPVEDHAAAD